MRNSVLLTRALSFLGHLAGASLFMGAAWAWIVVLWAVAS